MAKVYQCHACGGNVVPNEDGKSGVCEYCGKKIVFPKMGHEAMNRANSLRTRMEFEQAEVLYQSLVGISPDDPEVWWNILLCHYGILYVQEADRRVITVNRMKFGSIYDEEPYQKTMQYADPEQRTIYEREAQEIQAIQERLQIAAQKEEQYDIFISFKDKDAEGKRTQDSVLAQDIYDMLTDAGYRVFFSRITLRTAIGEEFEPKIFAALQSARMMILAGDTAEYVNADWVKNEWMRYLKLMEQDANRYLLPVYTINLRPEDLPPQLAGMEGLQANGTEWQRLLMENVESRFGKKTAAMNAVAHEVIAQNGQQIHQTRIVELLEKAQHELFSENYRVAASYYEDALDMDVTCSAAWWGKVAAGTRNFRTERNFRDDPQLQNAYEQALQYASEEERANYNRAIIRYEETRREMTFNRLYSDYRNTTHDEQEVWLNDDERFDRIVNLQNECLRYADPGQKDDLTRQFQNYRDKRSEVRDMLGELEEINQEGADANRHVATLEARIETITTRRQEAERLYPTTVPRVLLIVFIVLTVLIIVPLIFIPIWIIPMVILIKRNNAQTAHCDGVPKKKENEQLHQLQDELQKARIDLDQYNEGRTARIEQLKTRHQCILGYLPANV